jgi:hypothetical protein
MIKISINIRICVLIKVRVITLTEQIINEVRTSSCTGSIHCKIVHECRLPYLLAIYHGRYYRLWVLFSYFGLSLWFYLMAHFSLVILIFLIYFLQCGQLYVFVHYILFLTFFKILIIFVAILLLMNLIR